MIHTRTTLIFDVFFKKGPHLNVVVEKNFKEVNREL